MDKLAQDFLTGTPPKDLNGFYAGRLEQLIPINLIESLAGLVAKVWLPWQGKEFHKTDQTGINLVIGRKVFPFKTRLTAGLRDSIKVLQLDYDLPTNPAKVRKIVDELVQVEGNKYLGKAYLRTSKGLRLVAYFSLRKA